MTRRKWVRGLETRCAVAPKRDSYYNERAALWISETKKRKKKKKRKRKHELLAVCGSVVRKSKMRLILTHELQDVQAGE